MPIRFDHGSPSRGLAHEPLPVPEEGREGRAPSGGEAVPGLTPVRGRGCGGRIAAKGPLFGHLTRLTPLLVALAGCAHGPGPTPGAGPQGPVASADPIAVAAARRATLDAIASARDARTHAPDLVPFARDHQDTEVRRAALRAMGLIGDPRIREIVQFRLGDPDPSVRAEAAFALSLHWGWELGPGSDRILAETLVEEALEAALSREEDPAARSAVLRALAWSGSEDAAPLLARELAAPGLREARPAPEPAVAAAEGLGILGYRKALGSLDAGTRDLLLGLLAADPALARGAAYALFRVPPPPEDPGRAAAVSALAGAAADPGTPREVRVHAARALGTTGGDEAALRLASLLTGPGLAPRDPGEAAVAIAAVRGLARLPSPEMAKVLGAVLSASPDPSLRAEAAAALAACAPAEASGGAAAQAGLAALAPALADPVADVRAAAAASLAALARDAALSRLAPLVEDPDPHVRAGALGALADVPGPAARDLVLSRLASDPASGPRLAALDALGRRAEDDVVGPLLSALDSPDPVVAGVAAAGLASRPGPGIGAALAAAFDRFPGPAGAEARVAIVDALAKREPPAEELFARAATDPDVLVQTRARLAIRALGNAPPPRPPRAGEAPPSPDGLPMAFAVETERGTFHLRLDPQEAPTAAANFATLAARGYFDGLALHRVVPDFVVQGGDPRGDGSGGPGYSIRCDYNPVPYERGVVGMALAGKDTGGSQWFVTLSRQPHLDGHYTAFGRVVTGMEVVDSLRRGDRILSVRPEPGPPVPSGPTPPPPPPAAGQGTTP